jgi:hypothetical protein
MHKLLRKRHIWPRLALCALYVLFFAVQLNLRYNSVEVNQSGHAAYASTKGQGGLVKTAVSDGADKKSSITIRLNKRYFPGYFYLAQAPGVPSGDIVYIDAVTGIQPAPFLLEQYPQFAQRRGPPATC